MTPQQIRGKMPWLDAYVEYRGPSKCLGASGGRTVRGRQYHGVEIKSAEQARRTAETAAVVPDRYGADVS